MMDQSGWDCDFLSAVGASSMYPVTQNDHRDKCPSTSVASWLQGSSDEIPAWYEMCC